MRVGRASLGLLVAIACASCARDAGLLTAGQEGWIAEKVAFLTRFRPGPEHEPLQVTINGQWAEVHGHEGWVELDGEEWVYFVSLSCHLMADRYFTPDLVIAIDHAGNLYACNHHVCPHLFLGLRKPGELRTVEDFVSSTVELQTGGRGASRWLKVMRCPPLVLEVVEGDEEGAELPPAAPRLPVGCRGVAVGGPVGTGAAWGRARRGLQVRVDLEKTMFTAGERIRVAHRVRNASSRPIAIPRRMGMFYSRTHLSFKGEPDAGWVGDPECPQSAGDFIIVRPGKVHTFPHDPKNMELQAHTRRAGEYTFWAAPRFYGSRQMLGGGRCAGVDGELVLLLSWQDTAKPGAVIRLTIENRSRRPVRVIAPPDIRTDGPWWGLGAYDIRVAGPDGKPQSYQCLYPPLPKIPVPEPPETVVLGPGRSIGALVDMRRTSAKPWDVGKGKYTITATYEPGKTHFPDLAKELPLFGKKVSSNALTWQNDGGITTRPEGDPAGQGAAKPAKIDAFERGDARIALGMTKAQVQEQLAEGRVQSHKVYCFRKPPPDMFERDVWVLSYGPEDGGMGRVDELRVTFTAGKASSPEIKVVYCP